MGVNRCKLMGIVNVTPDSFSDGGLYEDQDAAIKRGLQLKADGADIVDIGGESTRPGAFPITIAQETYRVIPVIKELASHGLTISIDTMHAEVAAKAVEAGATIINDVTGGLKDPNIIKVAIDADVTYIASHYRAPAGFQDTHVDPLQEVVAELSERSNTIIEAGLNPKKFILDPGLGFAKNADTNWALLRGIPQLHALGFPLLIGASRKRFLRELIGPTPADTKESLPFQGGPGVTGQYLGALGHGGLVPGESALGNWAPNTWAPEIAELFNAQRQRAATAELNERLDRATAAVTMAVAATKLVWGVRVHNVAANREAIAVASAWNQLI